jgi:uncharacterized protein (DUF2141 family)
MKSKMTIGTRTLRRLVLSLASAPAILLGSAAASDAPQVGVLSIRLDLRSSKGQIGCSLFASEKGFPKDPSAALQTKWCPVANATSTCAFDPIPAGTYAVACFHDENKNGALDKSFFGKPTEGTAASNDARGFMGPPSFKDAKFSFAGAATELRLKVSY